MSARARLLPVALALAACRPGAAPPQSRTAAADPCLVEHSGALPADSVVVAAAGVVSATNLALRPASPADSFAFAQVYETLVRVTCDGRLVPALAANWEGDGTGRRWTMTLRGDVSFTDGEPVTARRVAAAWRERADAAGARDGFHWSAIEGFTIETERVITVHLRDAHVHGPRLLAAPTFAVHGVRADATVPPGTGPYVAPSPTPSRADGGAGAAAMVLYPRTGVASTRLAMRATPNDARDLIDQGADIMVTADRRVIDYAATQPRLRATPLPPDRAYVFLSPGLASRTSSSTDAHGGPHASTLRASLERDVIRSAAPRDTSAWWGTSTATLQCAGADPPPAVPAWNRGAPDARPRRLVYANEDRVAGELARRLVALASTDRSASTEGMALRAMLPDWADRDGRPLVTAAAMSSADLSRSLAVGEELSYLIALPRRALDPCAAWRSLSSRAPWLAHGVQVVMAEHGPTLITTERAPALIRGWDNTLRVVVRSAAGAPLR